MVGTCTGMAPATTSTGILAFLELFRCRVTERFRQGLGGR